MAYITSGSGMLGVAVMHLVRKFLIWVLPAAVKEEPATVATLFA
jgi:hypothetical protein